MSGFHTRRMLKYWRSRRAYANRASWLKVVYNQLLISAALQRIPLPHRRRQWQLRLRGVVQPFYVRAGTTDALVLEEIFIDGEYSLCRERIRSAGTVLDLGSHAGFSIRYWLDVWPEARVVAVEPDPYNLAMIHRNIRAHRSQVDVVHAGIDARCGDAYLAGDDRLNWGKKLSNTPHGPGESAVHALTVLRVLEMHDLKGRDIDLLKCDIEGREKQVFGDCRAWIDQVKRLAVELHDDYTLEALLHDLRENGARFEPVAGRKTNVFLLERQAVS